MHQASNQLEKTELDDIVEGCVREYLHKKGFVKTLAAFGLEKPKGPTSISSRELLRFKLGIDSFAASIQKVQGVLPSTIELLADYVVQTSFMSKQVGGGKIGGNNWGEMDAKAPVPRRAAPKAVVEGEEEAEVSMMEGHQGGLRGKAQMPHPSNQRPSAVPSQGFQAPPPRGSDPLSRKMAGMAMRQDEDDEPEVQVGERDSFVRGSRGQKPSAAPSSQAMPPQRSQPPPPLPQAMSIPPFHGQAAALPPGTTPGGMTQSRRPMVGGAPQGGRPGGDKMHVEEMEDFEADFGDEDVGKAPLGRPNLTSTLRQGAQGLGGTLRSLQGESIPQDTLRAINELLWGTSAHPPPSWHQGFFFNSKPSLLFGLVQTQGGPCGVLAGVQAHILAALYSLRGAFNLNPDPSQQKQALVAAMANILWASKSGSSASVALPPRSEGLSGAISHDQLMRGATFVSASSLESLQETLAAASSAYMDPQGWGVVLLVVSAALSRGVHVIRQDMDERNNSLMGMYGYCTQELVNLLIVGRAMTNVFDGNKDIDGMMFRGVTGPCKLGLLTLFEWYRSIEVGSRLKNPELPIWVICSESHFTVLFAASAPNGNVSKAMSGDRPFDLLYYDELANQEEIVRLTVKKDPAGGWTAKVGDSYADRGKCEGQNIPPLECVVETRWSGSSVNWNGTEPML